METNLSAHILLFMMESHSRSRSISPVKLSDLRKQVGIPSSTFHRHVETLLRLGIIERVKRDHYRISKSFSWMMKQALIEPIQIPMPIS